MALVLSHYLDAASGPTSASVVGTVSATVSAPRRLPPRASRRVISTRSRSAGFSSVVHRLRGSRWVSSSPSLSEGRTAGSDGDVSYRDALKALARVHESVNQAGLAHRTHGPAYPAGGGTT